MEELAAHGFQDKSDPCLVQSFELTSLKRLNALGSNLRMIMLLESAEKAKDEDLDAYKELGVVGIGLDKDLIVVKNDDGHINHTNKELIDRVSKGFSGQD